MAAVLGPVGAQASTPVIPIRTWRHILATRLARLSGKEISEACGNCDHTVASRIGSGQRGATIDEWCNLLEAMGLKVVGADKVCISPDRLRFLEQTTSRALANAHIASALWDEEPE